MFSVKYISSVMAMVLALSGCASGDGSAPAAPSENIAVSADVSKVMLPDMVLTDRNGKKVNLQDFKGKTVFVNLWATWCPPCRAELPSIQQLYNKTKGDKVQFVMLSLDDKFSTAIRFFDQSNLSMPAFYPAGPVPDLLNVPAIPTTFIFNAKGELVKKIEGGDNYNSNKFIRLLSR